MEDRFIDAISRVKGAFSIILLTDDALIAADARDERRQNGEGRGVWELGPAQWAVPRDGSPAAVNGDYLVNETGDLSLMLFDSRLSGLRYTEHNNILLNTSFLVDTLPQQRWWRS